MTTEPADFFLEQLEAGCRLYLQRLYFLRDEATAGRQTELSVSAIEQRIATTLQFQKEINS